MKKVIYFLGMYVAFKWLIAVNTGMGNWILNRYKYRAGETIQETMKKGHIPDCYWD